MCPVEALAGEQFDFAAGLARLDAVAVQLELVEPVGARWRGCRFERELRGDEGGLGFFGELGESGGGGVCGCFRNGLLLSFELRAVEL